MDIIQRKFLYKNDLNLELTFGLDQDFVIKHIEGTDSNEVSIQTNKAVGQIGENETNIEVNSKTLTIDGFIINNELNNRYKMLNIIIPGQKAKLYCVLENGEKYYLNVTVKKSPVIENKNCKPNFQIQFNVAYPFWRSVADGQFVIEGLVSAFKYPRNTGGRWRFSYYTPELISIVNNQGNYDVGMKITLEALQEVTTPKFLNVNTGEFIALKSSYRIQPKEIITITTGYGNKRITSSINGNIFKYIDLDSTFMRLNPGTNVFKYTLDQNKRFTKVNLEYDVVKVGI